MPKKSLHDYLSKLKKSSSNLQIPSKKWVPRGCKHPKTLSFTVDSSRKEIDGGGNEEAAATLADIDRFLLENFKSLYVKDGEEEEKRGEKEAVVSLAGPDQAKSPRGILFESPRFTEPPPGLRGSNRFFVAHGITGSLMEEARNSLTSMNSEDQIGSSSNSTNTLNESRSANSTTAKLDVNRANDITKHVAGTTLPNECIAVLTYSPDPYNDFRRSMQEMVEERLQDYGTVDWDFMEELLFCYLNLNDKKSYRYILSAYSDLVSALRQREWKVPARSRRTRIARERRKATRREEESNEA